MKNLIKIAILFFMLLSVAAVSRAQDTIPRWDQSEKMIQDALLSVLKIEKHYIEDMHYGKIDDDFYIWVENYPLGFSLTQDILDLNLKLKGISRYNLTKKQKKKGISGIAFSGVLINDNKLRLVFREEGFLLKDKLLHWGIDGEGYLFEYEYSCEKREWVLIKQPKQCKFIE